MNPKGRKQSRIPQSILVTGAAGFIGGFVVEQLSQRFPDANIYSLDSLEYCSSLKNLASLKNNEKHQFIKGNIKNIDFLAFILERNNIDTVIHLAAQSHVDNSFGNSLDFTLTNVYGTHVLLEACKNHGKIELFLHISTDEVYGENKDENLHEENQSMLKPTNPYASSKAAAELICQSYFKSFALPVIITRGNNVYGPRQYPEKLIPKFSFQWQKGKKLTVHGKGSTRRNYVHVIDVARAMVLILESGEIGQVYNIGGHEELSVLDIANKIGKFYLNQSLNCEQTGTSFDAAAMKDKLEFTKDRHYNDKRYNISTAKLEALGWKQQIEFDMGLAKTLSWYNDRTNWSHWGENEIDHALVAHPRILGEKKID